MSSDARPTSAVSPQAAVAKQRTLDLQRPPKSPRRYASTGSGLASPSAFLPAVPAVASGDHIRSPSVMRSPGGTALPANLDSGAKNAFIDESASSYPIATNTPSSAPGPAGNPVPSMSSRRDSVNNEADISGTSSTEYESAMDNASKNNSPSARDEDKPLLPLMAPKPERPYLMQQMKLSLEIPLDTANNVSSSSSTAGNSDTNHANDSSSSATSTQPSTAYQTATTTRPIYMTSYIPSSPSRNASTNTLSSSPTQSDKRAESPAKLRKTRRPADPVNRSRGSPGPSSPSSPVRTGLPLLFSTVSRSPQQTPKQLPALPASSKPTQPYTSAPSPSSVSGSDEGVESSDLEAPGFRHPASPEMAPRMYIRPRTISSHSSNTAAHSAVSSPISRNTSSHTAVGGQQTPTAVYSPPASPSLTKTSSMNSKHRRLASELDELYRTGSGMTPKSAERQFYTPTSPRSPRSPSLLTRSNHVRRSSSGSSGTGEVAPYSRPSRPRTADSSRRLANHARPDSAEVLAHRTTSPSSERPTSSTRARSSQATSLATFVYDDDSRSSGSRTQSICDDEKREAELEREFMAAVERGASYKANGADADSTFRLSMPSTAYSRNSNATGGIYERPLQHDKQDSGWARSSVASDVPDNLVYRGSKYASTSMNISHSSTSKLDLPVVSAAPLAHSPSRMASDDEDYMQAAFDQEAKALTEELAQRLRPQSSKAYADTTAFGDSPQSPSSELRISDTQEEHDASDRRIARAFYEESQELGRSVSRSSALYRSTRPGRSNGSPIVEDVAEESDPDFPKDLTTPRGSLSQQGALHQADSKQGSRMGLPSSVQRNASGHPVPHYDTQPRRPSLQAAISATSSMAESLSDFVTPLSEMPPSDTLPSATQLDLRQRTRSNTNASLISVDYDASLPPTPFSESTLSLPEVYSEGAPSVNTRAGDDSVAKMEIRRQRTIQELVDTERAFSHDMAVTRDIWLARAKGRQIGEIMAILQSQSWTPPASPNQSRSSPSLGESPLSGSVPMFERQNSSLSATSTSMVKTASLNSMRSLKGFNNPFSSRGSKPNPSTSTTSSAFPSFGHHRKTSSTSFTNGAALVAILSPSDVTSIFNNIEMVADFSERFLVRLEECVTLDQDLQSAEVLADGAVPAAAASFGQVFLDNAQKLEEVYSVYCSRFGTAIARYEQLSDDLRTYNLECKELSQGLTNAWDLPSLLIKPVQRCLKYPLLLQNLLTCTPETHTDHDPLVKANSTMLHIAETINELKRRQEIVGRVIKPRVRSDGQPPRKLPSFSSGKPRSTSAAGALPSSNQPSSTLAASVSKKLRRSVKQLRADGIPTTDDEFAVLAKLVDTKYRQIEAFTPDCKAWSTSMRSMLSALHKMSTSWAAIYVPVMTDDPDVERSGRTVMYFGNNVVKACLDGPWKDTDHQIKKIIEPKVSKLLESFRDPRAVINKRHVKYIDCYHQAPSANADKIAVDAWTAYHALNAQLIAELPKFMLAVDKCFSAILGRFASLQAALLRAMAGMWQQYVTKCCTQFGPPDLPASRIVSAWWQLHRPIVVQLDALKILNSNDLLTETKQRLSASLPPSLRLSQSTGTSSLRGSVGSIQEADRAIQHTERRLRKTSSRDILRHTTSASSSISEQGRASGGSILRRISNSSTNTTNRTSAASSTSQSSSLAFSAGTRSTVPSLSTPPLDTINARWQSASTRHYTPDGPAIHNGYPFLDCRTGDLFHVLHDGMIEGHTLVRTEDNAHVGWIPSQILSRIT